MLSSVDHLKKEIKPIKTYLSKNHYKDGPLVSVLFLSFLFLTSHIYWNNYGNLSHLLNANGDLVFLKREYYRSLTASFIHGNLEHLLSNSYSLFFLIYLNYAYFGPLLFPFFSLTFSILINLITLYTYPPHIFLLGSSGLVYLLAGCWFALFILLDRRLTLFMRFFKATAVALIIFFPQTLIVDVSYTSHFIGFIMGIISGIIYFLMNKKFLRSFEIYPENEDLTSA